MMKWKRGRERADGLKLEGKGERIRDLVACWLADWLRAQALYYHVAQLYKRLLMAHVIVLTAKYRD